MALLRKYGLPALLIVAAFVFPVVDGAFDLELIFPVIIIAIYILLALGLNIVVGFAGLLDLGFVAFYALGAYVVGWLASSHFRQVSFSFGSTATSITGEDPAGIHISFWVLLFIAAAFAGLCGVIIGAPTLRLRGDYLAIVTLGFGEIIPKFFQNGDNLGGFNLSNGTIGIKAIDSPGLQFLPDTFDTWQRFGTLYLHPWYYTILVLVLVTVYVNVRLRDSRLGRAWISVREDETAAAAMGINPVTTKLWAYALGAVFGGIAGAFCGAFIKNIFPDAFSFNISILVLCMVILGGMGNIYGVILGAIILQGLNFYLLPAINEWVHAIGNAVGSPALSQADIPKYNFLLFGLLLVFMMLLRPEGIIPNRQRAEELHGGEGGDVGDALGGRPVADENGNILEARGITKVFGGLVAVSEVDFDIPERSIVSLIGPNGAGKTTFFNMVSGLYEPTAGSFVFQGRDITRFGAHKRAQMGIGRTFQNIRLFDTMSAGENVLAGMHTRLKGSILGSIFSTPGTRREEREGRERAAELLDYVGIRERETFAKNLSYGDQRRLEIARALASEPKLLLLDEPTAGMNPQETARLTELIGRLREERGISILLIEHEMRVVMSISDRVTVLDHGEKISEGTPREVREDPSVIEAYLGTAKTG